MDVSRNNQLTASYGFGPATNTSGASVNPAGTPPSGVSVAADLTLALAGASWNADSSNTMGAWDFGTASQPPVLRYGDYDGDGTVFDCSQAPTGACGAPLPGQGVLGAQVPSTALSGAQVSLAGAIDARVTISSWRWRQLQGPTVTLTAADSPVASFRTPAQEATLVFELIATTSGGFEYRELFRLTVFAQAADADGNGLIEIHDLTMLHNMRHNLAGTSYKTGEDAVSNSLGCPAAGCIGYELVGDLDFDADGDGSSWTGDSSESYRLDADDSHAPYFVVDRRGNGGWQPVGSESNPFVAVFDGNGYAIRNLGIRRAQTYIGLFGVITGNAAIRNLGLVNNLADSTFDRESYVGGLVGRQLGGSITASYATGPADGGDFDASPDRVGGLVGTQLGGSITASYATGPVAAKGTSFDAAGGLVGWQENGLITASYATGPVVFETVSGGGGGLLGYPSSGGSITASYASGPVHGNESVGPLYGSLLGDVSIVASYGFGAGTSSGGNVNTIGAPPAGVSVPADSDPGPGRRVLEFSRQRHSRRLGFRHDQPAAAVEIRRLRRHRHRLLLQSGPHGRLRSSAARAGRAEHGGIPLGGAAQHPGLPHRHRRQPRHHQLLALAAIAGADGYPDGLGPPEPELQGAGAGCHPGVRTDRHHRRWL